MLEYRFATRAQKIVARNHSTSGADQINLGGGYAFPDKLPDLSAIAAAAARDHRIEGLQYGPLFGVTKLRDKVSELLQDDGINANRDNILVTNGAKNALDLVLKIFIEKGDSVIVSRPSYATGLQIIRNHEAGFVEIDMDEDGIKPDDLEQRLEEMRANGEPLPKLLYDVPDFHNPTGITLSASRRQKLVRLAEHYNFIIVEDDPYRRLRFDGPQIPSIKSYDKTGCVIGLGTISKTFAPGIRIGWAVAEPAIIGRLAAFKSESGVSPLMQLIVLDQIQTGGMDKHVREIIPILESHKNAMKSAIQKYLANVKVREPQGGYYYWVELPERIDADALTTIAEKEGVTIFSGRGYFANNAPGNFFRLSYAMSTEEQIEAGVRKLGEIVTRLDNTETQTEFTPVNQLHFD